MNGLRHYFERSVGWGPNTQMSSVINMQVDVAWCVFQWRAQVNECFSLARPGSSFDLGGTPEVATSFIGELADRSLAMIGGQAEVACSRPEDRQSLAVTAFYAR